MPLSLPHPLMLSFSLSKYNNNFIIVSGHNYFKNLMEKEKTFKCRREKTRNKMVILKIQSKYLRHFYSVFDIRQIWQFFQVNTTQSTFKSQMKCSLICEGSIWGGGWITANILNASYILCPLLHVTTCLPFRYLWNEIVTILILPMWKLFELDMPYEVSSSLIFKPLKVTESFYQKVLWKLHL